MIDALPAIVERHPETVYVIAGRTHPDVARREGERYRLMLERRVHELGLGDHVEFDDRFLAIDELSDLLAATDVFVTPYPTGSRSPRARSPSRSQPAAASSRPPTGTRRTCSPRARARLVPFDDPAAVADRDLRLHRAARQARRRAGGGAADRLRARLAVGRRGDRGGPRRGVRVRAAETALAAWPTCI